MLGSVSWLDLLRRRPSRDQFAQLLIRRLEATGAEVTYHPDDFKLEVGGGSSLFLANLHQEFCATPFWRRGKLLDHLTALRAAPPIPTDFVEARQRFLPVIRDPLLLLSMSTMPLPAGAKGAPQIAHTALGREYLLALVIDDRHTMSYVTEEQLADWNVPFERALAYALDNLATLPVQLRPVESGVYVSTSHDNYDSSRLLLPSVVRSLVVEGRPVAAFPHRDALIITGDRDPRGLAHLEAAILAGLTEPRPIGGVPLVFDGEGWSPFVPEDGSALSIRLRTLVKRDRAGRHAEQKNMLEQLFELRGEDVFVASTMETEAPSGEVTTLSVWSRGVVTLLPKTDGIAFFDPEAGEDGQHLGPFTWSSVEAMAPGAMRPEGLWPERWRVESFPTPEILARLEPLFEPAPGKVPADA